MSITPQKAPRNIFWLGAIFVAPCICALKLPSKLTVIQSDIQGAAEKMNHSRFLSLFLSKRFGF